MTSIGHQISAHGDPEAELAAGALVRMFRQRHLDRYRTWMETKAAYPLEWREAAGDSEYIFYLTAGELEQLNQQLLELLRPVAVERLTDPSQRPPGSVPVEMLIFSYPITLPDPGSGDRPAGQGAG